MINLNINSINIWSDQFDLNSYHVNTQGDSNSTGSFSGPSGGPGGPSQPSGPSGGPSGPSGGPGNYTGLLGGNNPQGNQDSVDENVHFDARHYDPSDPNQIPVTYSNVADLICYRLERKVQTHHGDTCSIASLFNKDTPVNIAAKEKISTFIQDNPGKTYYRRARADQGKMILGRVLCNRNSELVTDLRTITLDI